MTRIGDPLNKELDPEKLELCVPENCSYVQEDDPECQGATTHPASDPLMRYLESLGLPPGTKPERGTQKPAAPKCEDGYFRLRGRAAIEHARRVHRRIYRQLLRFENVTAVDVGYAVAQRHEKFLPELAIRIHVSKKHPVGMLAKRNLYDLVSPRWAPDPGQEGGGPAVQQRANPWAAMGVSTSNLTRVRLLSDPEAQAFEAAKQPRGDEAQRNGEEGRPARKGQAKPSSGHSEPGADGELCECCGCRCSDRCPKCKRCCCCCCCCCCHEHCGSSPCRCHSCSCYQGCRLAICGVPLDIIEANYFPDGIHPGGDFKEGIFVDPMVDTAGLDDSENLLIGRGRVTPLVGGISVGGVSGLAGTLGAIVWDETDGSPCILGNWHVLAGRDATVGQPCYQPSIFDGGCDGDEIGRLKRWHFGELGDAAIAELDGNRYFASGEILGLWHPLAGHLAPNLNMIVRKWGRTTGFTEGFIDGIDLATQIDYGNGLVRFFEKQFHVAPLYRGQRVSQVGDSGSLLVTEVDLDDQDRRLARLERAISALLRKDPKPLIRGLKNLVGGGAEGLEDLIVKIEVLLASYPEPSGTGKGTARRSELSDFKRALDACQSGLARNPAGGRNATLLQQFKDLLCCVLDEYGINHREFLAQKKAKEYRQTRRVYYAVGMLFAGDTPGSPFGEFALASDIGLLADDMRFSLRPVFEPRSSFRKLRLRPERSANARRSGRSDGPTFEPGTQRDDPRGGGPQPDGASYQSGGGNTGGNG